jgi:hypothetical protein
MALLLFQEEAQMGSGSSGKKATDDQTAAVTPAGDSPSASEPANADAAAADAAKRARDKIDADEWLAGGAEEAGYGYGV